MSPNQTCSRCGKTTKAADGLCANCRTTEGLQDIPTLLAATVRYFGDYELQEEIARGGMGVVYQARQTSLKREVALKMILSGHLASATDVQRFRIEAQAAANLRHPNIVPIYEIGEHEGQHYFSMEYVAGRNLADITREQPLSPSQAARYVQIIARAIDYAHEQGTLHRDLKPSNVLIDQFDNPRITDFGLAKRIQGDSEITVTGQVLGSPNFMSPEQAAGRSREVGVATDVYGLGAILYHLLTARPPFLADTLHGTLEQVLTAEPAGPRALNPNVPVDLQTICLKCLEKHPAQRYSSAFELAEDLRRFLQGEPIHARPASWIDRGVKWVGRRPAIAALSSSVVLVSVFGLTGILWQWHTARQTAARETYESYTAKIALAASKIEERAFSRAEKILESCPMSLRNWEWGWLRNVCQSAPKTLEGHRGSITLLAASPDGRWLASADRNVVKVWDLSHGTATNLADSIDVAAIAFSTNSTQIALATISEITFFQVISGRKMRSMRLPGWLRTNSADLRLVTVQGTNGEQLAVWDTDTAKELARLPKPVGYPPILAISSNGRRALMRTHPSTQAVVNLGTGEIIRELPITFRPDDRVILSPDGTKLFTLNRLETGKEIARIWDVESGQAVSTLDKFAGRFGGQFGGIFSASANRLVTWRAAKTASAIIEVWDVPSGRRLSSFAEHQAAIQTLAFSPDEKLLLSADLTGVAKIWEGQTGQQRRALEGHIDAIETALFLPGDQAIVTGGRDKMVRIWNLSNKEPAFQLAGTRAYMRGAAFSPNGQHVLLLSVDKATTTVWDCSAAQVKASIIESNIPLIARFCSETSRLATLTEGAIVNGAYQKSVATIWDIEKQRPLRGFSADKISMSRDGNTIIGLDADWIAPFAEGKYDPTKGSAKVTTWDEASGGERASHTFTSAPGVEFSADGDHLCMLTQKSSRSPFIEIFRPDKMQLIGRLTNQTVVLGEIFVLPKAKRALVRQREPDFPDTKIILVLVDLQTGHFISQLKVLRHDHEQVTPSWAFHVSPENEKRLLLQSNDSVMFLFDTKDGKLLAEFSGHSGPICSARFFPDGLRILTASEDQTAKVWDATTGRELLSLVHGDAVSYVAIAPQGDRVLTVCRDGSATIFSARNRIDKGNNN